MSSSDPPRPTMLRVHFSFGAHEPEDLPCLAEAVLRDALHFFQEHPGGRNVYFKEGAANSEADIAAQNRALQEGRSLSNKQLVEWAENKSLRTSVKTAFGDLERLAGSTGQMRSEYLLYLYRLDAQLGGRLYAAAQMYLLERLHRRVSFDLDGESYSIREQPTRLKAEFRTRDLERQVFEAVERGEVALAVALFKEMTTQMVANQAYRDASILNQLARLQTQQADRSVRVFVRIGVGHRDLVEHAIDILETDSVVSFSVNQERADLPSNANHDDLRLGRRTPTEEDYVAAVFSTVLESFLSMHGMPRAERRALIRQVIEGVSAAEMATVLERARQSTISGSMAAFLEQRNRSVPGL